MVLCARVAGKSSLNTMTAWCHPGAAASCANQLRPKIWKALQIRNPTISKQAVLCDIEPMLYDCILAVRLKNTGLDANINVCFVTGVPYLLAVVHLMHWSPSSVWYQ